MTLSVLRFCADSHHYGKEIFSAYYRSLIHDGSAATVDVRLVVSALWGGLVRSDSNAIKALRLALEKTDDPEASYELLRMLALTGSEEDLPVLLAFAERDAERGYPLLALLGLPAVMPHILKGLEAAKSLLAAYSAWLMLTNVPLPMRPRLMLVSEMEQSDVDEAEASECPMIPDVSLAGKWWDTQKSRWKEGTRWFSGAPMTIETLSQALGDRIGAAEVDVQGLIALHLQQPLDFGHSWECQRQAHMKKLLSPPVTAQFGHKEVG